MVKDEDRIREKLVSRAVNKAFKETIKEIESEPARTVIESDGENDISEQTAGEIMAWLFRRDDNDSPGD